MNASSNPEMQALLGMTTDTIGKDILAALVQEIRLLPDVWTKLSQSKQEDIIDRLHKRVAANVAMAVRLIHANGRREVVAHLEQVNIKDEIKAVFKVQRSNEFESMQQLFDSVNKECLLVVAGDTDYTAGMDEVHGDPDQPGLDLGGGREFGSHTEADSFDGEYSEVLGLPSPTPDHDGIAAEDPIYADAVFLVITEQKVNVTFLQRYFRIGYNRASRLIEQMEIDGVVSAPDANGARVVLKERNQDE